MKVGIIGGGGRVGSCAAFALQCLGAVDEIVLLDVNADLAAGEALDLLHGSAITRDQRIYAGDYADLRDADMVIITAGLRRKPDESRLELINRNVKVFVEILDALQSAPLEHDAFIFVVSNPVDILTRLAIEYTKRSPQRVFGLGTVLDTIRFCSLIADDLKVAPTQVRALILGEHGDSMVPIWSSATINGLPLTQWPAMNPAKQNQLFQRTKTSGAEMLKLKGGAGWAVGLAIREVVDAVALNQHRILPISTQIKGTFGVSRTCFSVPTVVGRQGVLGHVELELWPKERTAIKASAAALDETYMKVGV
jgi:L-lactate dehydrogenase